MCTQSPFFHAQISWDDTPQGDENLHEVIFCEFDSEEDLRPNGFKDDDIFHYGLTLEKAKSIIGKSGYDSGEGDFTIQEIM
jgi:hypothetical protein